MHEFPRNVALNMFVQPVVVRHTFQIYYICNSVSGVYMNIIMYEVLESLDSSGMLYVEQKGSLNILHEPANKTLLPTDCVNEYLNKLFCNAKCVFISCTL
jgi:hypothetical protein